ncbi:MAG: hypothetical protein K6F34_01175 [Lachnospiraceae bacterium]|nr:hypothetical protein [Lachnospiraceae bacterium]
MKKKAIAAAVTILILICVSVILVFKLRPHTEELPDVKDRPYTEEPADDEERPNTEEPADDEERPNTEEPADDEGRPYTEESSDVDEELVHKFSTELYDSAEVYVPNEETARRLLRAQGELLRDEDRDEHVMEVERYLETTYDMESVYLKDMEPEIADAVKDACDHMYGRYPILNGYLTNITVKDEVTEEISAISLFETETFIMNDSYEDIYPMVIRKQILLRAKDFENGRRLQNMIKINVRDGYWTEGTDVSAVIVHELGHALISCIISDQCGLGNTVYIDGDNADAYSEYNMQQLSDRQDLVKDLCNRAYDRYRNEYGKDGSYEDFCKEISDYAQGLQDDGGISYDETVAEAISNGYVHGDDCVLPAALILEEIDRTIGELQ